MLVVKFTWAAAGKGAARGQEGQKEAIPGTQARDDSDTALKMGRHAQNIEQSEGKTVSVTNMLLKMNY